MKSKTTAIWFVLAVVLAAAIWVVNNYFQPAPPGEKPLFPGLRPSQVTALQVIPGGALKISVIRTNQTWLLDQPFSYPAQAAAIDGLLDALQKLTPVVSLSAGELNGHKNADAEFGFDNPQFTLDLDTGDQTRHLIVGNKTAPGDGVYVRVVGMAGAYVTDVDWLGFLPHTAADWRDTTLVNVPDLVDWLVVTNGSQAIELRRDVTNHLWRMVRPIEARADNLAIVKALTQLRLASVSKFVTDDPKADLTTYGLEPPSLDVWLGSGTNLLSAVHGGKDVSGVAGEMYARREGWNTVVTTAKAPLAPWRGTVNDFRDRNLLELTAPVAEIEVHGENGNYTLQKSGTNTWTEAGAKFSIDPTAVQALISALAGLRIADFVQDVVTPTGLQAFGLARPSGQVTIRSVAGDTNSVMADLLFGLVTTNGQQYVKRSDEDSVYALWADDQNLNRLSLTGDFYRSPRVWDFPETNVAQVTLRQNGKTRQLVRNGTNDWSIAAGSGIINSPGVEETVYRLSQLQVLDWVGRSFNDVKAGLSPDSLTITVALKSGEKYSVQFGEGVPSEDTGVAVVTLEGERWAFLFPPVLYRLVAENLTIPEDAPAPGGH